MEVNVNHEIREYKESMFFGLSLRQFIFSLLAVVTAVALYFSLSPKFGTEMVSWICILGAIPFAAMGYVRYHGMNCEQFVWVWLRCQVIEPKRYIYRANNLYYTLMEKTIHEQRKEAMRDEQNTKSRKKTKR